MNDRAPNDSAVAEDELVAFLDDELSPEEAARVSRRLLDDPAYQQRLSQLQKAWDLLDTLQKAEPDAEFTRSTVEMVAIQLEQEAEQAQTTAQQTRLGWWVAGGVAIAISAAAGFWIVQYQLEAPERKLLKDWQVIQRVDQYQKAESVEFLERLRKEGLFPVEGDDGM